MYNEVCEANCVGKEWKIEKEIKLYGMLLTMCHLTAYFVADLLGPIYNKQTI